MGRKRWWAELNCLAIVLILLIEATGTDGVGEVGCLFDKTVCKSLEETCYDDAAFGRCIERYSFMDAATVYHYNLEPLELEILRTELEKLIANKYQWSHPYTQCVMTSALESIRYKSLWNNYNCEELQEPQIIEDLEPVNDGISPLAVVNFMPSRGHGYGDFANEMYYPPALNSDLPDDDFELKKFRPSLGLNQDQEDSDEQLYQLSKRLQTEAESLRAAEETQMLRSRRHSRREALNFLQEEPYPDFLPKNRMFRQKIFNNSYLNLPVGDDFGDIMRFFEEPEVLQDASNEEHVNYDDQDEDDNGEVDLDDYSEIPYWQIAEDISGFKRPERLDVKKPGPYFSTNNYAFKVPTLPPDDDMNDVRKHRKNFVKKELVGGKDISYLSLSHSYENVDMDHAFIKFDKEIHSWIDGERIVQRVAKLLGLKQGDLTGTRVGYREITFKVMPNKLRMNATQVAGSLGKIREDLEKDISMKMTEAGIGDKIKITVAEFPRLASSSPNPRSVLGIIICVVFGAIAAATIVLIIIVHRQAKTRRKLAGLATPDPEASKDYQELCRARMQAKVPPSDKPESPRIVSLSRESESNRSSTSSWGGDDPAALSNMDISTGHMVLSYMEDHLKNKDRLNQEWTAICAYSPDPASVAIATDKDNAEKNRQGSVFPYDHSRIVLNDLTNLDSSDYINASTITDHDPRNPAYIATQGPLPQTSADFWQLVWEQGSVVIVMLTRLTEEGQAMCHRYWPEEGSELYHIYEVHLVSEHIWCDDYLVRSFYLKNLRTGETRTVTQFHFLSWPENGVPQSTKALLEFRRKVNKSYRGRSCPIVVHCSDGAGRTGTYCLIDMVLNRMAKGAKEIDIAAALEHIRDQRPGMVSTKQQFEFVLVAVAEEVHAILKALPVQTANEKNNSAPVASSSDK